MKYLKRILYFFYYLKEENLSQISKFKNFASVKTGKSGFRLNLDSLFSIFRYNISFKDYYCGKFYELSKEERKNWAGAGFMYEFQLKMNPRGERKILENKIQFLNQYKDFVEREFISLEELKTDRSKIEKMLSNPSGRLVLKDSLGQVGAQVEIVDANKFTPVTLPDYMEKNKYDLVEEYVIQHPSIMEISPTGLNTIRIFTQLDNGKVHFLGSRFRISVNSAVDNLGAGNLAAPVDNETGEVNGPAVYSDITKEDKTIHPVTRKAITGFIIPHWDKVKMLAERAALHNPANVSIGWDIAVKETGPELIEGNHNWCRLLWQMPVKQGLKKELEYFL